MTIVGDGVITGGLTINSAGATVNGDVDISTGLTVTGTGLTVTSGGQRLQEV